MWLVVQVVLVALAVLVVGVVLLKVLVVFRSKRLLRRWGYHELACRPVVVGFFHPYSNAGGGGERVLWHSVQALQRRYSFVRCVVYTGQEPGLTAADIMARVQERFGIVLLHEVKFVFLKWRGLVEAKYWPRFTLLGQAFGSFLLGLEALLCLAPHVYVDSMGYAFTVPLFRRLGGCKTASYVHYPVVSCDMLSKVRDRQAAFNNASWISQSRIFTTLKIVYYRLFASLYGFVGRSNDVVMVNSTWTQSHIAQLWRVGGRLSVVYPPCDTRAFQLLPLHRSTKQLRIISIGQFRPEKNHRLQLQVFSDLLRAAPPDKRPRLALVLVGSCRGLEDHQRADELKEYANQLGVLDSVEFRINLSFEELKTELSRCRAALHTMTNEHFGIGVVESMAAGCLAVVHASGGPKLDIVVDWQGQQTGFLADSRESFMSCLLQAVSLNEAEYRKIAEAARTAVHSKFSAEMFENSFLRATECLFS